MTSLPIYMCAHTCTVYVLSTGHLGNNLNTDLLSDGIDGEELPLLLEGLALGKAAHCLTVTLDVLSKLLT